MHLIPSLLYLALFLWAGISLARRVCPEEGAALWFPLGSSIALAMLEAFPALFSLALGFRLPAALLAGAVAFALGIGASARRGARFTAGEDLPAMLACVLPLWLLSLYLLHTHVLLAEGGAYYTGQSCYGDLPMHLAFIKSIAVQGTFPPEYPLLAGQSLFGYPFLCESVSSVFLLLGADLRSASLLPAGVAMVAVFGMGWQLAYRAAESHAGKASLAYALFFVGSGFGFFYFLGGEEGNFTRIFTAFYETPTNYVEENVRWVNPIADLLVPQRATLFGWATLFACLYLLYRFTFEKEHRLWPVLGLMAGTLPLTHTHSLLALVLVSAGWLVHALITFRNEPRRLLPWLGYAALAGALCLPQLFGVIFRQTSTGNNFLRFHFNWANEGDPYFWFYIKNIGIVYLLLIPAFVTAGRTMRWMYSGGLLILLIAEFVLFQPNPYDNNKILFIWHLLGCILTADFVWDILEQLKSRRAAVLLGSVILFLGTFGSVLTLGREAVSSYRMFGSEDIAYAAFIEEKADPEALFLTGTHHLNPVVSLAGRNIVCGSSLYVYYHGMNYSAQEQAVRQMYESPTEELLAQWGVDYVSISSWERGSYQVDEAFYVGRYPVWYQNSEYTVYDVR
ncbi:MAG: hypothetical protein IJ484_09150 [Oscillospiraceae bacterium]|nr:hypothetical protein [Oscillospiraceae bacterium]